MEQIKRPGIDIDYEELEKEQLQSLSGKKKVLYEIEEILKKDASIESELPALSKIRGRRGAMKSHPAITMKDLKILLKALMELSGRTENDLKILERV